VSAEHGGGSIADIVRQQEVQLTRIPQVFADRSDGELSHHASPDEWCAKQIIGHLIEAEGEVFTALIPGMLGRDAPEGWQNVPSMVREECGADADVLLTRWRELRERGIVLAGSLTDEDLLRTSEHNWHGGTTETVGDLFRHWPFHTDAHESQALEVLRAAPPPTSS
ncbi:MAG: DinB family protein, partial [Chloroflexota bacterium]|nr:DinB family protein [Chloroflexota bacterium]